MFPAGLWIAASACLVPVESELDPEPVCDGRLQPGEEVVDGPWDLDRDGHYDFDNFRCSETYGLNRFDCDDADPLINASQVEIVCNGIDDDCSFETPDGLDLDGDGTTDCTDCDDEDPLRSPDLAEICWDGIDNDCTGEADEGCGPNYNGVFELDNLVFESCAIGEVLLDVERLEVSWTPPRLEIVPVDTVPELVLVGTIASDGTFSATDTVQDECNQQYRIDGLFLDANTISATFRARYGAQTCLGCPRELDVVFGAERVELEKDKGD